MNIAKTENEIFNCFDVLKQLRPNLDMEDFVETVRSMQEGGYELGYLELDGSVVSVSGFRICNNFAAEGKALYIYDLITAEKYRSQKFGTKLIEDTVSYAKEHGCKVVHLDSNVVRHKAHKFYFRNGFSIAAHHFLMKL